MPRTPPMGSPTIGTTKKPTTAPAAPSHTVALEAPAPVARRFGTTYPATVAATARPVITAKPATRERARVGHSERSASATGKRPADWPGSRRSGSRRRSRHEVALHGVERHRDRLVSVELHLLVEAANRSRTDVAVVEHPLALDLERRRRPMGAPARRGVDEPV